jgi:hypothetical protein
VVSRKNILRLLGREVVAFGGFLVSGGGVGQGRGFVTSDLGEFIRLFLDSFCIALLIFHGYMVHSDVNFEVKE